MLSPVLNGVIYRKTQIDSNAAQCKERITVIISRGSSSCRFKMRRDSNFRGIFSIFAKNQGFDFSSQLVFSFAGKELLGDETPADLEISGEDEVVFAEERTGGFDVV